MRGRSSSDPAASIEPVTALADLPLLASGKVREIYDLGDELLLVASDRISTYDVVHPTPIPGKGDVLTGLSTFWFRAHRRSVPNHLISVADGVPDEARGRAMVVRKLDDAERRVRRTRLHNRLGLEGLPGHRGGVRHRAPGRPAGNPTGCPSRSSRRARRPTSGTTRRSISRAQCKLIGDRALAERVARRVDRAL